MINKNFDEDVVSNCFRIAREGVSNERILGFRILGDIYFSDDIWDFNSENISKRSPAHYLYNFLKIDESFRNYVKFIILREIISPDSKYSSIKKTMDICQTLTNSLYNKGIIDTRLIDFNVIEKYIEEKEETCKYSYLETFVVRLSKFIIAVEKLNKCDYTDIKEFLQKKQVYYGKFKPSTAINDYIPDKFNDIIISMAIKNSKSDKYDKGYRLFCCLLIIIAETGMRSEDLLLLERGNVDKIETPKGTVNYLKFLAVKDSSESLKETYTYLSEIAFDAYNRAEELRDEIINDLSQRRKITLYTKILNEKNIEVSKKVKSFRELLNVISEKVILEVEDEIKKYLFISSTTGGRIRYSNNLREYLSKFFVYNYYEFIECDLLEYEWDTINYMTINEESWYNKLLKKEAREKISLEEIRKIKFPVINYHRFRVTVCTKLFLKNIPIDFIRRHMNHLYEEMTIYYCKTDTFIDQLKENLQIFNSMSKEGLIDTDNNNIKTLEDKETVDNIEKINKFLKNNKLNIVKDINKILMILKKTNGTVAENEFGICILNTINSICNKRETFTSIEDNYFIGIRLENYKNIDLNYERFIEKEKLVIHNLEVATKKPNLMFDAKREKKALIYFINNTLMKELELLENDIDSKGKEEIISKYDHLTYLINNLVSIREELEKWIKTE